MGLIAAVGATIWGQLPRLNDELQQALTEMQHWLERSFNIFGYELHPQTILENLQRSAGNALATVPASSLTALAAITDNLLWSTVVLVSFYYFLKDGPQIKPWLVSFLPPQAQPDGQRLLDEIDTLWSLFLRVQFFIFAVLALLMTTSTILIIWLFRNGWLPLSPIGLVVLFILVYTAIQQVDNLWLRPQFLGRSLKLHPGVVFVGLITALALSGVLGALIIVPLLATCKIIGRYIHALLLGLPPWPPSPTHAAGSEPPLGCVDISGIRCHFEKERREIPQKVVGSKGD
jgi:predicted PurR-regulated permease PerM